MGKTVDIVFDGFYHLDKQGGDGKGHSIQVLNVGENFKPHGLLINEDITVDDDSEPIGTIDAIPVFDKDAVRELEGRLLTVLEATFTNENQFKAVKTLVQNAVRDTVENRKDALLDQVGRVVK